MRYKLVPVSPGFAPQTSGLKEFVSLAERSPAVIVAQFRSDADAARRILNQSYDKRFTPSTFIDETKGGFQVGWFDGKRKHVRRFPGLPEEAADYLLYSFGRGRLEVN